MPGKALRIEDQIVQAGDTGIDRIDRRIVHLPEQVFRLAKHALRGPSARLAASVSGGETLGFGWIWKNVEPSVADVIPFIQAFAADPRRVGAIAPSGRALAEAITAEISPDSAPVIELGPGTGAFTRQILERGVPEGRLALIEFGGDFAHRLRLTYPRARVLQMDATRLRHVELFGPENAGAVVSGLPLLPMSTRQIVGMLDGAFRHLRPGGAFYQFTYGPRCPVPRAILERLGLKATRIDRVFANVPPAGVYRITRRARHHSLPNF